MASAMDKLSTARQFRLLVFDWDGTLADSTAIIAGALQQACRDLDLPAPDDAAARFVIGLGLADALRHIAPTLPSADYPRLSERYREHYLARDPEIPLFGGAREMLDELDARGFQLAIATGKTRVGLTRALAQQRLAHRFVASRCADEGFPKDRKSTRLNSSHSQISYAVFCLKKKKMK